MSGRILVSEGVGERIAGLMRRRRLTVSALSERSGIDREVVDAALGRDRISPQVAMRLARALGAGESYLLRGDAGEGDGFEVAVRAVPASAVDEATSGDDDAAEGAAGEFDESVSQAERVVRLLQTLPLDNESRALKLAYLDALDASVREDGLVPPPGLGGVRRRVESGLL